MNVKEVLKELCKNGVLDITEYSKNYWYTEDASSYYGWAKIYFNDNDEVVAIKGEFSSKNA